MNVNDIQLLGRLWATDIGQLSRLDTETNGTDYQPVQSRIDAAEHQLASLVGDDLLTEQHLNRAKLFALAHPAEANQAEVEANAVTTNSQAAGIDLELVAEAVRKLALKMNEKMLALADQFDTQHLDENIDLALKKLLASQKMTDFCKILYPPRNLSPFEMLELKNATLGLVKLIQSNRIGEDAILHFIDTEAYDLRNTADLVKIASETSAKLKANFIDEKGIRSAVDIVVKRLVQLPGGAEKIVALREKENELISARKHATKVLDVDLTGRKSEEALKAIKESFRAFRYDLDIARGKTMSERGEAFRRFWDNFSIWHRAKISKADYRALVAAERALNDLLLDVDPLMREGYASVEQRAEEVTSLTHETNDMIRAHFEGEDGFASALHELFDPMVKTGGHKRVQIGGGVDYALKLGAVDAKAGLAYDYAVEIEVQKGGGRVGLTFLHQGGGDVSATGKLNDTHGLKGHGDVKFGKGETAYFPSLDDAIKALKGGTLLTNTSANAVYKRGFFAALAYPFKMLGSGVSRFLRWTGALAKKIEVDNVLFRRHLKERGVLGKVDDLLARGKNTLVAERKHFKFMAGGVHAELKTSSEGEELKGAYAGRREFGMTRKVVKPFAEALAEGPTAGRFAALAVAEDSLDGAHTLDDAFRELAKDVRGCVSLEGARTALVRLGELLDALESGGAGKDEASARVFAYRLRFCAAAYAALENWLSSEETESTRRLILPRLSNPPVELPEKVYRELLMTEHEAHEVAHTVHTTEISASSAKISGRLTVDTPVDKTDARPWKRQQVVRADVRVDWDTPINNMIEFIAEQVAAKCAREPHEVAQELAQTLLQSCGPRVLEEGEKFAAKKLGELFMENEGFRKFLLHAGLKALNVAGKALKFAVEKLPLKEVLQIVRGFETEGGDNSGVGLSFTWKDGRFQSFACSDEVDSYRTVGLRFAGVGAHLKTATDESFVKAAIFPDVTIDTAMEYCEGSGTKDKFHNFVMKNARGMLELVRHFALTGETRRETEARELLRRLQSPTLAAELGRRLEVAKAKLAAVAADEQASDYAKLNALEPYVAVLTEIFRAGTIE